jgi:hypothetical protein
MCGKKMEEMVDHGHHLRRCREKAPLIMKVEGTVGWRRLWGELLEFKYKCTKGLKVLSRLLGHHGKGKNLYPLCDMRSAGACIIIVSCIGGTWGVDGGLHLQQTKEFLGKNLTSSIIIVLITYRTLGIKSTGTYN